MENHSGPVVYYPIAICVGFFPWSLLFAPVIMDLIQRVRARHAWRPGDVLCISWVAAWVGIFSLASTKFPHYVVPAYPALALATGAFATRWVEDDRLYKPLARRCLWATLALVGVAILVAVPIVAHKYQVADASLGLVGAPLLIGALSGFVLTERGRVERAMAALCGTAVLFLVALFGYAAVVVDRHQNSELFAAAIRAIAPGGDARLVTWRYFRPGLVYYFNGRVDVVRQRPDAARSLEHTGSPVFLLTREDEYRALAESLPRDVKVLARSPWFLQSDRTLVLVGRETALAASDRQSPQR
jgi:4-amino-4-deoxy-L-arabinose transferase-like glycosyltransferase